MRVALLKSTRRLPVLILAVSCSSDGPAGMRPPFITTFDSVGDTIVASTTGDVPESLVRHLVVDWRVLTDTASEIIGDVHAMAVGSDGRVWVWDNTAPALWLLDANGESMRSIGRPGSGPGEYRSANDIAVTRDGGLVMWDAGNSRLNFYNPDGSYRATARLTFHDCCGLQVTIDTLNRIWLTTHPRTIGGKERPVDVDALTRNEIGYIRYDAESTLIDTIMAPRLPGADAKVSALHITSTSFGGAMREVPYRAYARHQVSPLGHIVSAIVRLRIDPALQERSQRVGAAELESA